MGDHESHSGLSRRTVVVDLDGVAAEYDGWRGIDVIGVPKRYARACLHWLREHEWRIVIFTCRLETPTLKNWPKIHNVPCDHINDTSYNIDNVSKLKPQADIYLDDHSSLWDLIGGFDWPLAFFMLVHKYHPDEAEDAYNYLMQVADAYGGDERRHVNFSYLLMEALVSMSVVNGEIAMSSPAGLILVGMEAVRTASKKGLT